jgi:hypothetical protein
LWVHENGISGPDDNDLHRPDTNKENITTNAVDADVHDGGTSVSNQEEKYNVDNADEVDLKEPKAEMRTK